MKGIFFRAITLLALGLPLLLVSGESRSQVLEQTFSENVADFTISTPNEQWFLVPRSVDPGPVRATLRFETPVDKFTPNATVRVSPLIQKDLTAKKMVDRDLKKLPPTIKILEKKQVEQGGHKGYQVIFIDETAHIQFWQRVFVAKDKSFVITCATRVSTVPRFEEDFKKILTSFKIR